MGLGSVGRVGFVEVGFSGSCYGSLRLFERHRSGGEGLIVGWRRLFLSLASISGGGFSFSGSRVWPEGDGEWSSGEASSLRICGGGVA